MVEQAGDVGLVAGRGGVDQLAIFGGDCANLKQAIDEHAQSELGRHAAGGNMRAVEQAKKFEILHDIADGCGRQPFGHAAGQRARAHRIARGQIAFDDAAKHLARAVVHLGQDLAAVGHVWFSDMPIRGSVQGLYRCIKEAVMRTSMRVASGRGRGTIWSKAKKDDAMRPSGRKLNEMRPVSMEIGVMKHAEGSCLIKMGETHVLCSATIEDKAPPFLKNTGLGWVTAEYGMLPRATNSRMRREAAAGKQSGRTQEIQRLIGRALRAGVDRSALGERQIVIDCDVIQADGGTRCASITGGWVALRLAMNKLLKAGVIVSDPMMDHVAAVSCGIYAGQPVLDLDYPEDSAAGTDGNFILTGRGRMIEVQMSAEGATFSRAEMGELLDMAEAGVAGLVAAQKAALGIA